MSEAYKRFERLAEIIDLFLQHDGAQKLSGTMIDDDDGPPIYHAHALLDNHEYIISIVPTELESKQEEPK